MKSLLIRWGVIAIAVWATDLLVSGMTIQGGLKGFLIVALVFGLINAIIKPIFKLLTCPLVILTLGLFTLVINTLMLLLVEVFLPEYLVIDGFFSAFIAALLISIATTVIGFIVPDGK
jgi:putative membrane protein